VRDLKQLLHETVDWYVPDATALEEGAHRRVRRSARRRRVATAATSLLVFAVGALVLWTAFRPHTSEPSRPTPTPGTRITVATGDDPIPWELWLTIKDDGVGTHFGFGGPMGGGCCDRGPMSTPPLQPNMAGGGVGHPGWVIAWANASVRRVVFVADTQERVEGTVYPVPGQPQGFTHIALVLVPEGIVTDGELIGYDDNGEEIGRVGIGLHEAPGPTREIDRVWTTLREARDFIQMFTGPNDDTLSTFDLKAARQMLPTITWNASPVAIPNEVSIRGLRPIPGTKRGKLVAWKLAIVSATPSGQTYCIAISVDQYRSSYWRYGTQDARSFSECKGRWPEVPWAPVR
jgi:hypothetical protein